MASFAKELVRVAAYRYGIDLPRTGIRFAHLDGPAGSLQSRGDTYFIDVDQRFQNDDRAVFAIVAHEFGHIFLRERRIARGTTAENEELTDAAAVLAGYGVGLARVAYRQRGGSGTLQNYSGYEQLGYLPPTAIAYLTLARARRSRAPSAATRRSEDGLRWWHREAARVLEQQWRPWLDGQGACPLCGSDAALRPVPGICECSCCGLTGEGPAADGWLAAPRRRLSRK